MTRTSRALAGCTAAALAIGAIGTIPIAHLHGRQQASVFRVISTHVGVDVSVRLGNKAATGLTAADFVLTDNGVRQEIEASEIASIPIDVTLVLDASSSTAEYLRQYREDVTAIAKTLRPTDRIRLLSFGSGVREVFPMTAAKEKLPVERLRTGGFSALYDALTAALVWNPEPNRRHLIVVFTDGGDNFSIARPGTVLEAARRVDAVLHLVRAPLKSPSNSFGTVATLPPDFAPPALDVVDDIARVTGGDVRVQRGSAQSNLKDFKAIFEDYQASYLIRFKPAGVSTTGWHEVSVRIAKPGDYTIRSRRGYYAGDLR